MAKQLIGVGAQPNDGTGDTLRTAMVKCNENFNELYADMFSGSYADLTNKPTIPSALTDLGITDGTSGQVLTTDGSGTFSFANQAGGVALTDLSVTVASTASGSGNLVYDDETGEFTFTKPDLSTYALAANVPADLTDLGITDGSSGQVLTTDGNGAFTFETPSGGSGGSLQARTVLTGTTNTIQAGNGNTLDITGFKSYALLAIEVDGPAWVRIYTDGTSRTSDLSRAKTTDPSPDAGVIAEIITNGPEVVKMSPGVIGFNFEATPTTTIPCQVNNESGSAAAITVKLTVVQLEA